MSLQVTTVNLNGIRAAHKRGFLDWVEAASPSVLLMQEVRAPVEITAEIMGDRWEVHSFPSEIKGRAGVAVAVDRERGAIIGEPVDGLSPSEDPVDSGRWTEVVVDTGKPVRLVSAYLHSGEVGTPKQVAKMSHLERVGARMSELLASDEPALVAGDFNVVRSERDIKNWKPNHNKRAGVLDEEIAHLEQWLDFGWKDTVRELAGERQGPYSWWSWRGKAFDNDAGWRIDYQYATPDLAELALDFDIFRAPAWDQRFSDHAPVTVRYQAGN